MVVDYRSVVDRTKVLVWIALLYDAKEPVPILHRFILHEIELVRERSPNVPVSRKPRHDVTQIPVIGFRRHLGIPPVVVRMEQNQVRFDTEVFEIQHALLQMPEELGICTSRVRGHDFGPTAPTP